MDERLQQLHDKATRGAALSAEEQSELDGWYAGRDQEDYAALTPTPVPQMLDRLHAEVDQAVAQLTEVVQRIRTLTSENEATRRDIAELQRKLAQRATAQPV